MTPFVRESGSGPAVLCLHSNASTSGQWRALMELLALAMPQRVSGLVLFEPTLFPLLNQQLPGHPAAAAIAGTAAAAADQVDRGDLAAAAQGFIDYWMGPGAWAAMPEARRAPVAESMRPIRLRTDAIFAEPWSLGTLAALQVPTLLLGGALSPPSVGELLPLLARTLPRATLQVMPGLGHMAPATHPALVNPGIEEFLLTHT